MLNNILLLKRFFVLFFKRTISEIYKPQNNTYVKKKKKIKTLKIPFIFSIALSITIIIVILFFTVDANTINQLSKVSIKYEFFVVAIFLSIGKLGLLSSFLTGDGFRRNNFLNVNPPFVSIALYSQINIHYLIIS